MPYAPLISKIRCHNPNRHRSSLANRNYLTYIATREGVDISYINDINELINNDKVDENEGYHKLVYLVTSNNDYLEYMANRPRSHGLFGNVDTSDLSKLSKQVSDLTTSGKNIYRGIISLSEKDAESLGYTNKQNWSIYLKQVMPDIAKELGVNMCNFTWVAAFHAEKTHPHVHYELWDNTNKIKTSYIHTSVQHKCRNLLSKAMFNTEYENYIKEVYQCEREELNSIRNRSRQEITNTIKDIMKDIDEYIPGTLMDSLPSRISIAEVKMLSKEIINLSHILPTTGSIDYAYLPPHIKDEVNKITQFLFDRADVNKELSLYLDALEKGQKLIGKTKFEINIAKDEARNDIYKRASNIILKKTKNIKQFENQIQNQIEKQFIDFDNEISNELSENKSDSFIGESGLSNEELFHYEKEIEKKINGNKKELHKEVLNHTATKIDITNDLSSENLLYQEKEIENMENQIENDLYHSDSLVLEFSDDIFDLPNDVEIFSKNFQYKMEWHDTYKEALDYLYNIKIQNFDKAFSLLKIEESRNNVLAIHDLGKMFEKGLGRTIDIEQAEYYYSKAFHGFNYIETMKPNNYIEYRIGKFYDSGKGVKQDYNEAANWYQKAADQNHKYAQYSLGVLYLHGKGFDFENEDHNVYLQKAFSLFEKSAEQNNAYAAYELGKMYEKGVACEIDINMANQHYKKALNGFLTMSFSREDDNLMYRIGKMYYSGIGTEKNIDLAETYFEKSARLNNMNALYMLAKIHIDSGDINKIEEAIKNLKNLSDRDHEMAQYFLAKIYMKGIHIEKNIEEAIKLLEKASEKNNQFAQYQLGKLYYEGKDVNQDIKKAIDYLTASATQNNEYAQYALGKIYSDINVEYYDMNKAITWYIKSAEQGNQFAQYQLGKMFYESKNVNQDINKAIEYLIASSTQNNEFAQYALGKIYSASNFEYYDIDKSIAWYMKSAEQGNQFAQYQLGKLYFEGKVVNQDISRAIEYLTASATQNNEYAQYTLGRIYSDINLKYYDIDKAISWYVKSAEQGNQFAQYQLGKTYLFSKGVERNEELGIYWLRKAIEQGNLFALQTLEAYNNFNVNIVPGIAYGMIKTIFNMTSQENKMVNYKHNNLLYMSKSKQALKERAIKHRVPGSKEHE